MWCNRGDESRHATRHYRPGKDTAKLRLCFLVKAICIYIKDSKKNKHKAIVKTAHP